ncbi:flippase [Methanosarcina sp. KYL-1]|uniref:flippase n=1 Tax=Methanosarcina sp. KYL-1 TaxID=2602068 RepID=UPI002100F6E8|nr:flippase [Methanosarcina sp. KYL-1]MCQ1535485.1 flippase [Methanosarcina sp. KYL-1]
MQSKKKFIFDASFVLLASLFTYALNFLRKPLLARYLGPEGLGLFAMVTVIAGFVELIASFGVPAAVIKYESELKDKKDRSSLILSATVTMLLVGTFFIIVLIAISGYIEDFFDMPSLGFLLNIYALAIPFSLMFTVILTFFNGIRSMKCYSYISTLKNVINFVLTITLLILGYGLGGVVTGSILAVIIGFVIAIFYMKGFVDFKINNFVEDVKKLASFGSKMLLSNSVGIINYKADIFLIGYFLTATDIGYYSVALSLSEFFWILPGAIQQISYPATSDYWAKKDINRLNKMVDKSMKYSSIALLVAGLTIWIFAEPIIVFLFGTDFISAVLPLKILLIGTIIFGSINKPIAGSLAGAGFPNTEFVKVTISAVVGVVFYILLTPLYGITGAALATTLSLIFASFINIYFVVKKLNLKIDYEWYFKLSLTAALFVYGNIKANIVNQFFIDLVSIVLFTTIVMVFFLSKEDKRLFKSLIISIKMAASRKFCKI